MRRAFLLLAIALAPACKRQDNTKIVVAVWSDLAVPTESDTIRIEVAGPNGNTSDSFRLTAGAEPGKTKLPAVLELVPLAAKNATFTVKATGQLGMADLVSQSARVSFVSGQALLLKLFLGGACKGASCGADFTCSAGACSQPVALATLPAFDPRQLLVPPDAGAGPDSPAATETGGTIDNRPAEPSGPDLRPLDVGSVVVDAGELDVPMSSGVTGGSGFGGQAQHEPRPASCLTIGCA